MTDPILDIFRDEAAEHLRVLELAFLDLENAGDVAARTDLIDRLFRHAHTLKGDARAVGLDELQSLAQLLEDRLDQLRSHPERIDRAAVSEGLKELDQLRNAFDAWKAAAAGESQPAPAPAGRAPPDDGEQSASMAAEQGEPEGFTVRVPAERLDRLLALAGELRIQQRAGDAALQQIEGLRTQLEQIGGDDARHAVDAVIDQMLRLEHRVRRQRTGEQRLSESLDHEIRQSRLLPLMVLAESLRRPVRELADSLGKQVRYQIDVGRVLLDKAVIEALKAPLLHLVRNAVDHGVESPDLRESAGKPREGTLRLTARQRGDRVQITLSDDGSGINFAQIRRRVQRLSELDAQGAEALSPEALAEWLFRPGFSTAEVGDVSGRGVGLDVVRDAVHRLHGRVRVDTSVEAGAAFVLTIPVTISTIRILTVYEGGQYYGIPSAAVVRTGRAAEHQLRSVEGVTVLPVDGNPVAWTSLGELLGNAPSRALVRPGSRPYFLLQHGSRRTAVAVEELDEESEVVLKPLGFPLAGMRGVLGGTIRPDGAVQIVLDLVDVQVRQRPDVSAGGVALESPPRILIVDDSPTTRAVLRNLLAAAGYAVRTAVDGVDALEKLKAQRVDLLISDFEMPRLNGPDLTRQVKARYGMPVILVTGREHSEHRRAGLEAGADAYVVKSTFQGESLLDVVRQLV